jgi:hypothetical protein
VAAQVLSSAPDSRRHTIPDFGLNPCQSIGNNQIRQNQCLTKLMRLRITATRFGFQFGNGNSGLPTERTADVRTYSAASSNRLHRSYRARNDTLHPRKRERVYFSVEHSMPTLFAGRCDAYRYTYLYPALLSGIVVDCAQRAELHRENSSVPLQCLARRWIRLESNGVRLHLPGIQGARVSN